MSQCLSVALCFLVLVLGGCAGSRSATEASGESPEKLRARIARAGNALERNALLIELSHVELERARRSHTIFGYRRFLQEFPQGEAATTARALLESLRFEEAEQENSRLGWESFLAEHPQGRHTDEARRRLTAMIVREALEIRDLNSVRQVLSRYRPPDENDTVEARENWQRLVELEDLLTWEQVRTGDLRMAQAYLDERPAGRFRTEVRERRDQLIEEQILAEADIRTARERIVSGNAAPAQKATAAELELRLALRSLDIDALNRLISDDRLDGGGEEVKERARTWVESLREHPLSTDAKALMSSASRGKGLRNRLELRRLISRGDPRLRAEAIIELAEWGDSQDLDILLDALDARYVEMRLAAVAALSNLASAHPAPVWSALVRKRMEALASGGLAIANRRRLAALRESVGDRSGALAAWEEVARLDPDDPTAYARILQLQRSFGDKLSVTTAATALLRTSLDFGEYRWPRPPDPDARFGPDEGELIGLPKELTMLRQLCSAIELAEDAITTLDPSRSASSPAPHTVHAQHGGPQVRGPVPAEDLRTLALLHSKRQELEATVSRRSPESPLCTPMSVPETVKRSREARATVIERLGRNGDQRLIPFLEDLRHSPSNRVSTAAITAVDALRTAATPLD